MADEDEIQEFISITATSRRCAIWFITHNSDLNEAVESYFENGESSIPDDFDPSDVDDLTDFGCEEEEEYAESEVPVKHEPEKEAIEPTISPIQLNINEEIESAESISPQQLIKKKIDEGSKLTYILKNHEQQNKKKVFNTDNREVNKKANRFKQRNNAAKTIPFVIWKNGYSVGNVFNEKKESEMKEIIHRISVGIVPSDINDVNDIQLVDRSSQMYDTSFDPNRVLFN